MPTSPVLTGAEYLAIPRPPQTFIIEPLLPVGGMMTVFGEPKAGKSYLAMQMALAIDSGTPFLGFPVKTSGKVVYIQLDTPPELWASRMKELRSYGYDVEAIYQADLETMQTWPFNCFNPEHALKLREALSRIEPLVVIFDTYKEAHQLDENDATESQKVIACLHEISRPAAMILLHHSRKPSQDKPEDLMNSARGSGYLIGKSDVILMLGKRTLQYVGRATERGSVKIVRADSGFWEPAVDEVDQIISEILTYSGSDREHAKMLSERIKRSEEACRSLIRRYKAAHSGTPDTSTHSG